MDQCCKRKGKKYELIIFGSSSLLIQGICRPDRVTMDIDLIEPKIDTHLQLIAAEIAEEHGISMQWLNSAGHIFSQDIPKQWRQRTKLVFKGEFIIVKTLGRKDLIATKFYSYCMRNLNTDKDDLIDLHPSKSELNFAKEWTLSLKDCPNREWIITRFEEILQLNKEA